MANKLYLVEISGEGTVVISEGRALVQAPSPTAAKRAAIEQILSARKVEALEALHLSAQGLPMIVVEEDAEPGENAEQ
jgi:hypothetical protein